MIKVTIGQLLQAESAFVELGKTSFPSKLSWKIGKITEAVRGEIRHFNQTRDEKIKSYGNKLENGSFQVPENKFQEFTDEMNELGDTEVEIWGEKIKVDELGEREITASIFQNAGWLFTEGEEKVEGASA